MALSKLRLIVILVICCVLATSQSKDVRENVIQPSSCVFRGPCKRPRDFTSQSKDVRENAIHPSQCVFRGPCNSHRNCKSQCGPPDFPPETIGFCQPSPRGHGNICCCAKD
ncbi:hypothetical protein ISN45_Aa01g039240 [Arabidopsis thaliana x Arabidopsis arenosa]|uniref:Uncharacterized protein n=1 Tax=Arabidopsis thaliana x Arabidopsis arenosa TaxID=1240361 RepID=A0A8T2C7D1_9BRAS|nr:hypothetical protein ISN45_Aa01g039240 [Arabidopsis thaliana x Arabidopsis arenosa]